MIIITSTCFFCNWFFSFQAIPTMLLRISDMFHYCAPVRDVITFTSVMIVIIAEVIDVVDNNLCTTDRFCAPVIIHIHQPYGGCSGVHL